MARDWTVLSGVFVLAAGVLTVGALLRPVQPVVASPPTVTSPALAQVSGDPPVPATSGLPGVSSRISRVLEWNGDTQLATDSELAQLPPAVAQVLIGYGVPLRIPLGGERG